jgi:hypothetical protein
MPKKENDFGDDARAREKHGGRKSDRHDEAWRREQTHWGRDTDRSATVSMRQKTAWERSPNTSPERHLNFIENYMNNPEKYEPQDGSHLRDTAKRQVAYGTGQSVDSGAVTQQNKWEAYRNTRYENIAVRDFATGGYPYKEPPHGEHRQSSASGDKGKGKGKEPDRGSRERNRENYRK